MISEGFYLIPWREKKKKASSIGPKPLSEHIINHSIITAQSILMPTLIIDCVGDNPLIVSHC